MRCRVRFDDANPFLVCSQFYEVGAGAVLTGLMKHIVRGNQFEKFVLSVSVSIVADDVATRQTTTQN